MPRAVCDFNDRKGQAKFYLNTNNGKDWKHWEIRSKYLISWGIGLAYFIIQLKFRVGLLASIIFKSV